MNSFAKLFAVFLFVASATSQANELDLDLTNVIHEDKQGTVVLRVNNETNEVSVFETRDTLLVSGELNETLSQATYEGVENSKLKSELDEESGVSSWYFYWGFYTTPSYYYYGYYYRPYYTYRYGYYSYYCYNRWFW